MSKVLALTTDGRLTFCSASEENRGKGRCNHVTHQKENESTDEFMERISIENHFGEDIYEIEDGKEITQEEIDDYANKLDEICGCKVTMENYEEVMQKLTPEQIFEINKIGFESSPNFSLPITDEEYFDSDLENKLYFSTLPDYGVSGKKTAITQMFDKIGETQSTDKIVNIESNYKDGLSPDEYFEKLFSARAAAIQKSKSSAIPGYISRKLFYALSDIEVKYDCRGDHSKGILGCKCPGGICKKCLEASGVKEYEPGRMIGGILSTQLGEGFLNSCMKAFHTGGKNLKENEYKRNIIAHTYDAYSSSPIIEKVVKETTTEGRRRVLFEELKKQYKETGTKIDDYNLMLIAKKLTSYKRDKDVGTRFVEDGECCDIISIAAIGNMSSPFKRAELESGYKNLTVPGKYKIYRDSAEDIIFR